jgi:hypothetical protein
MSVSHEIVESPPHQTTEIYLLVYIIITIVEEISIMVYESHFAFITHGMSSVETPAVPCVEGLLGSCLADIWLFVFLHP